MLPYKCKNFLLLNTIFPLSIPSPILTIAYNKRYLPQYLRQSTIEFASVRPTNRMTQIWGMWVVIAPSTTIATGASTVSISSTILFIPHVARLQQRSTLLSSNTSTYHHYIIHYQLLQLLSWLNEQLILTSSTRYAPPHHHPAIHGRHQ